MCLLTLRRLGKEPLFLLRALPCIRLRLAGGSRSAASDSLSSVNIRTNNIQLLNTLYNLRSEKSVLALRLHHSQPCDLQGEPRMHCCCVQTEASVGAGHGSGLAALCL